MVVIKTKNFNSICASEFWVDKRVVVEITCLMPNGAFIPLCVDINSTFLEIKENLWKQVRKYPLTRNLRNPESYNFVYVNSESEFEELDDENKKLCEVTPFGGVFKLTEKYFYEDVSVFNAKVSSLIGRSACYPEFESTRFQEIRYFRSKMKIFIEQISIQRRNFNIHQKLRYHFPPRLISAPVEQFVHGSLARRLNTRKFLVVIYFNEKISFETTLTKAVAGLRIKCSKINHKPMKSLTSRYISEESLPMFTFSVQFEATAVMLLTLALRKKVTVTGWGEQQRICLNNYTLKVLGRDEYIYGNYKLVEFSYINECLSRNKTPVLVVVPIKQVPLLPEEPYYDTMAFDSNRNDSFLRTLPSSTAKYVSSFTVHRKYGLLVTFIYNLSSQIDCTEVGLQIGLFHAGIPLCQPKYVREVIAKENVCEFNNYIEFDITVSNLPRMAKLCFAVYEICKSVKNSRSKKYKEGGSHHHYAHPIGWVNTTVFDFQSFLKTGPTVLHLWSMPADLHFGDLFNPSNTVASNPDTKNSVALHFTLNKYYKENIVVYPCVESVVQFGKEHEEFCTATTNGTVVNGKSVDMSKKIENITKKIGNGDIHEQDRKLAWSLRYHIMIIKPELLPKLAHCIDWNNRFEVAEMISILQKWPLLSPMRALELLDCAYTEPVLRSFAVRCLNCARDDFVITYLLQLIQVLKHESYFYNDLVIFLLSRAFTNLSVAHYLFWHLRSEAETPAITVYFGLILDIYCRGAKHHVDKLLNQVLFLDKMKIATDLVRSRKDREKCRQFMRDCFREDHCQEVFQNMVSPLDPAVRCKNIRDDKCRVMDSKARPFWLVFENADPLGTDIYFIFKTGDDLRQDMLTLQLLRIMDTTWKAHSLDLRLSCYQCIASENHSGFIEVVLNAETIANIQKSNSLLSAASAFRKESLFVWLRDNNPTPAALERAIEEFTYSCAGYCVATFILGVADRHSDNIMIKRSGQLFHIDFGHILGHFKEKFGIRRERVPFVITHDFVYVINKGQTKSDATMEFRLFRQICKEAFLIIRQHGSLVLSLFNLMISTGLPEIQQSDLNYLHDNLVLHLSNREAEAYFLSKFDEALHNSWKTSLNWASHNIAKNNR